MSFEKRCIKALRDAGYRITQPRTEVINCLSQANKPLSAPKIFERLSERPTKSKTDRVSVYRTLEILDGLHLVHRTAPSGDYVACGHQCRESFHVLSRCRKCGAVEEVGVSSDVVAPLLNHVLEKINFTLDSSIVHIEGCCSHCSFSQ